MSFRTSTRWFDPASSVKKTHHIPFVSKSGKFSASTLYFWRAFPEQVLFSVISTVYSRILKISLKRKIKLTSRHRNDIVKVSIVYAITKDDWVIDRFLGICKNSTKAAGNFAHYCVYNLDEDKRFVYSQAFSNANWLKFQAFGPSDKSSYRVRNGSHLRGLSEVTDFEASNQFTFQNSVDFWEVHRVLSLDDDSPHCNSESDTSSFSSEPYLEADDSEWDSD